MNYRHIYHAGNISDVVKHVVLTLLLEHLRLKETPFGVLDTHAGTGFYDLQDERAQKTSEAQDGIYKLLTAPPVPDLAAYYDVLKNFNPGWSAGTAEAFQFYPGSPLLVARLLRSQDRLIACELHRDDAEALRRQMRPFAQTQVHHRDGYEALRGFLPLPEKRGLVLIDPPYETPDEFDRLAQAIREAYARWPQGLYAIWYPVKERPAIWRFHEALAASGIAKQLCAEFIYHEETRHDRLNGCGFILINPPWQFDERLRKLFPLLHDALQTEHRGVNINWLSGEAG
ncbi:MAG: 23S rRNA (adenine(2030)-N(6))-methyltransferase RlmJ [Alphaproteobacteria bacterium]|nr:23S rRNA (adenine(2030)-N(6))-methyltransferase RlmJ [Alphaproteobacteria bacterium]